MNVGEADSGTYDVYVNVMARMGTVPVGDEEEDYPNNLDRYLAGLHYQYYQNLNHPLTSHSKNHISIWKNIHPNIIRN